MNKTYEGTVVGGEIRLLGNVRLQENTRVYVVVPDATESRELHVRTPRLVHPGQAHEFEMEVSDEAHDADV
jgi:hypothetical protein